MGGLEVKSSNAISRVASVEKSFPNWVLGIAVVDVCCCFIAGFADEGLDFGKVYVGTVVAEEDVEVRVGDVECVGVCWEGCAVFEEVC